MGRVNVFWSSASGKDKVMGNTLTKRIPSKFKNNAGKANAEVPVLI
jgi:hypothetical protein